MGCSILGGLVLCLGVFEVEQVIGVGRSSSASVFLDEAGVDQFGEGFSELSIIAVPEGRPLAVGL